MRICSKPPTGRALRRPNRSRPKTSKRYGLPCPGREKLADSTIGASAANRARVSGACPARHDRAWRRYSLRHRVDRRFRVVASDLVLPDRASSTTLLRRRGAGRVASLAASLVYVPAEADATRGQSGWRCCAGPDCGALGSFPIAWMASSTSLMPPAVWTSRRSRIVSVSANSFAARASDAAD